MGGDSAHSPTLPKGFPTPLPIAAPHPHIARLLTGITLRGGDGMQMLEERLDMHACMDSLSGVQYLLGGGTCILQGYLLGG